MSPDLCLLLLKSLGEDCEKTAPALQSFVPPIQDLMMPPEGDGPESAPIALALLESMKSPKFGPVQRSEIQLVSATTVDKGSRQSSRFATAWAKNAPRAKLPLDKAAQLPRLSSPVAAGTALGRRPASGPQLYQQRQLSLQAGQLYTRISPEQFEEGWLKATAQPSYEDWLSLLANEARAAAAGQGTNRLEVILGDSMGLWMPPDALPRDRLWLNQGISGDTTGGILWRLSAFAETRPSKIHLLAGINDLKNGVPQAEIVRNMEAILSQLRQQHPDTEIVVYSVLPTRWENIPNDRVRSLNYQLSRISQWAGVTYRDMHPQFQDPAGSLRTELTTDGLHLNSQGYRLWQQALLASAI